MSEVVRLPQDDVWRFHSQTGSHRHFTHLTKPGRVTVAGKPSVDLYPKTLATIFKQAQMDRKR